MLLNFFNNLENTFNVEELKTQFATATPLPHVIVDDFLPASVYAELCKEISSFPEDKWIVKNLPKSGIRKEARDFVGSPVIQETMIHLTSHMFVNWMNKITGCDDIIPDVHNLGAGLTSAPASASLGLHVDFNWNNTLKLNRKFNLLLYSNEVWQEDWDGNLEFWNKEKTECLYSITPKPNRLVFWEYEQNLIHGHPKILKCPDGIERQNLMTVYYSSNATPTSQPHKSDFY